MIMNNTPEQNNEIYQNPQHIYLIQEREFFNSKENIYKIGRTTQHIETRINQYPKKSILKLHEECLNCAEVERNAIRLFKEKFKQRKDIGTEYFQGDSKIMSNTILNEITRSDNNQLNTNKNNQAINNSKIIINNQEINNIKILSHPENNTNNQIIDNTKILDQQLLDDKMDEKKLLKEINDIKILSHPENNTNNQIINNTKILDQQLLDDEMDEDEKKLLKEINDKNIEPNEKRINNLNELKENLAISFTKEISQLLKILQDENQNYNTWICVGIILFTISNSSNMFKIWSDWSSVNYESDPVVLKSKWTNFNNTKKQSDWGLFNLRKYAKERHPEEYKKFYETNIFERTKNLLYKNSHFDTAKYFYSLKPNNYIFKKGKWYFLNIHNVWEILEKGESTNSIIFDISETITNELTDLQNYLTPDNPLIKLNYVMSCKIGNSSFTSGVVSYLQTLYKNNKINFDTNGYILPFDDCYYDLKEHKFDKYKPEDYVLITTGYNWLEPKNEDVVLMKELFAKIQPDIDYRNCFMDILCSGLYGLVSQSFVMMKGEGGNGKSVINGIMLKAMGKLGHVLNNNILCENIKSGGANTDIANLDHIRFGVASEPDEKTAISNSTIRELTGNSTITARKLYENMDQIILLLTLVLELNDEPLFKSSMKFADSRRFIYLLFRSTFTKKDSDVNNITIFKANPEYMQPHFTERVKTALLVVLFEHNKLKYKGDITIPEKVQLDTDEMLSCGNEFLHWFNNTYEKVLGLTNTFDSPDKEVKIQHEHIFITFNDIYEKLRESDFYRHLTKIDKRNLTLTKIDKRNLTLTKIKEIFITHPVFKTYYPLF